MIIDSMGISMGSARSYRHESGQIISERNGGAARMAATHEGTYQYFNQALKIGMQDEATESMERSMLGRRQKLGELKLQKQDEDLSVTLRRQSLLYLLMHLHQIMGARRNGNLRNQMETAGFPAGQNPAQERLVYDVEEEQTVFETKGTVRTKDGREIDFNLSLNMTRRFEEYYYETYEPAFGSANLVDPLVINYDGVGTGLTDQKFLFDIDGDGAKESLSGLQRGSGFLAYDQNGDGVINDGSELFGTKSGNGFKDLAKYDSDGNGWIDEADAIFQKLKIWTKDARGKDVLYSLKELGIGALCLYNQNTQFSLNNQVTNEIQGVVRSTGFFLYESGEAGTMQQIDLASH